jgi:hypothetical protein
MALGFPFGFRVANPEPLDSKYGPYASIPAALASVAAGERYVGLTVNVNGVEYWWKSGTTNGDLVEKIVSPTVVTTNIAGNVTIDLSAGRMFILTLTGNVTSFSFSNEVVGREYIFVFKQEATSYTLTWAATKFAFPYGNIPLLTDRATSPGPVYAKDIVTALCTEAGVLDVVVSPDLIKN